MMTSSRTLSAAPVHSGWHAGLDVILTRWMRFLKDRDQPLLSSRVTRGRRGRSRNSGSFDGCFLATVNNSEFVVRHGTMECPWISEECFDRRPGPALHPIPAGVSKFAGPVS